MIPLEEAQAFVLSLAAPLPPVELPLQAASGLVLAEPVVATEAVPPFANSAMDGFAVRSADVGSEPRTLRLVGTVAAGSTFQGVLGEGEAVRIMTGAPMPAGADAVVVVERCETSGGTVTVPAPVGAGDHVRAAGSDMLPGDVVVGASTELGPGAVAAAATLGIGSIRVVPRPRVGVLSTGDELVQGGGSLAPGQIRDSNRPALLALVQGSGFEAVDLGCIPDDEAALTAALESGVAGCDAVLSTGGVSMGDFDLVKVVLDRIARMRWMQVAIKPAKPLAAGVVESPDGRQVPVIGLPGNPVSSMVSFELFARPALRRLGGHGVLQRTVVTAEVDGDLSRRPDGKIHFVRVSVEAVRRSGRPGFRVRSTGAQGSHQITAMARADGLAVLPDGVGAADGAEVEVMLLR